MSPQDSDDPKGPDTNPADLQDHPAHVTDDPGVEDVVVPDDQERHPSSGEGMPSVPRHPGGGVRQAPRRETARKLGESDPVIPGEILYGARDVIINDGAPVTTITVVNTADRPIQVGSHFHFAEVNPGLQFDRAQAWGKRLAVLSGGSMRFEPGVSIEVPLIPIRGRRIVRGLRGEVGGPLDGSH